MASQPVQKNFLILGDSLTEGYGVAQESAFPQLLNKKALQNKLNWKITSSGSSGSTSASGLDRIRWVSQSKPDFILILLGSNDGLRGLKIEDTIKNLSATIEWAQKNNLKVALGQLEMPPNYGKEYTAKFSKLYKDVAKKYKIPLAPFLLEKVAGRKNLNIADGIHPNEKGHELVAETLWPFVQKIMQGQ